MSDAAARKKLGKVSHDRVPVMFFGTLEIAWIGRSDIVAFSEGIRKGFLGKGKHKNFIKAVAQVRSLRTFRACEPVIACNRHGAISRRFKHMQLVNGVVSCLGFTICPY